MPRGLLVGLAAALVIGVAVLEGYRSNRWGATEDVEAAAKKLERVPLTFGDWVGEDDPLDPKVLKVAEAAGHVSREYANAKTKQRFKILLLCGPSGPIGAHTPDACYGGLGYSMIGQQQTMSIALPDKTPSAFWTARFEKKAGDAPIRAYWAWGVDGKWEASRNPRADFVLRSALYKLYVVRGESSGNQSWSPTDDPVQGFLTEFLPEVKKALDPPPAA